MIVVYRAMPTTTFITGAGVAFRTWTDPNTRRVMT
jgi:hypothetical protein